jgi:tripartite-type tricarboxylate transporter receptor subunit TctC
MVANGLQNVAAHVAVMTVFLTFALSARVSSSSQKTRREPMKTMSRAVAFAAALASANFACSIGARAQDYPSRPITMIVPFPAGGPTDTLGRILGEGMRVSLGQPIVVENVTGAGSTIGVGRAAQAAPDGYTLSLGNWTSFVGSGALYNTSYDLLRDFEPISLLTFAPMLIVGKNRPKTPRN